MITGNIVDGIVLDNAQQTVIQGNSIGTDSTGASDIGNNFDGITIEDGASGNIIGLMPGDTTTPPGQNSAANVIAYNLGAAVVVLVDTDTGNVVRGNSIYGNGPEPEGLNAYTYDPGIVLGVSGRVQNQYPQNDAGTGPNGAQNFPTSTLVKNGSATEIIGTLKSLPNTSFTLDFYFNPTASLQDVRQGQTYLGSSMVTTDASGFAGFDVTFAVATTPGEGVTATATGPNGTSELEFMYTRPLLVVPGIGGSFPDGNDFNSWLVTRGFDPAKLLLDPLAHSYDDLIQTLENIGYVLGQTLFAAAYDWRMPVAPLDDNGGLVPLSGAGIANDITNQQYTSGVDYLGYWLEQAATSFGAQYPGVPLDSVDVVAHSTGGLIARAYIQSAAYGDNVPWSGATTKLPKINNLIMIGVPNLGAPKAFNILNNNWIDDPVYEYVFSRIVLMAYLRLEAGGTISGPAGSSITAGALLGPVGGAENYQDFIRLYVPSVYDLMTIEPFLTLSTGGDPIAIDGDSGPTYSIFRNSLLLNLDSGDYASTLEASVQQLTVIYGTGLPTVTSTTEEVGPNGDPGDTTLFPFGAILPQVPAAGQVWYLDQNTSLGDGTVPVSSSDPFAGDVNVEQHLIPGVGHQDLTAVSGSQEEVLGALGLNTTSYSALIHTGSDLALKLGSLEVFASLVIDPVGAILTDLQGQRLGYTTQTGVLDEIPNSVFLGDDSAGLGIIFGNGPGPVQLQLIGEGQPYTVYIQGNDGTGAFGNSVTGMLSNGQTQMVPFKDTAVDTTTALQSGENPSKFGDNVTFTATVSPVDATNGTPTGLVQFSIDGASIGNPVPLDENGIATFTTPSLAVGSHTVTVNYINTDGFFNPSNGTLAAEQVVITADTSAAVGSSSPTSVYGQSVTFTATVAPVTAGLPTPTGLVEFFDGMTELDMETLDSTATATFSTSDLLSGTHSITVQYVGDGNFSGSTSLVLPQVVISPLSVASIAPVSPNPRNTAVSSIDVTFSEPINVINLASAP